MPRVAPNKNGLEQTNVDIIITILWEMRKLPKNSVPKLTTKATAMGHEQEKRKITNQVSQAAGRPI